MGDYFICASVITAFIYLSGFDHLDPRSICLWSTWFLRFLLIDLSMPHSPYWAVFLVVCCRPIGPMLISVAGCFCLQCHVIIRWMIWLDFIVLAHDIPRRSAGFAYPLPPSSAPLRIWEIKALLSKAHFVFHLHYWKSCLCKQATSVLMHGGLRFPGKYSMQIVLHS